MCFEKLTSQSQMYNKLNVIKLHKLGLLQFNLAKCDLLLIQQKATSYISENLKITHAIMERVCYGQTTQKSYP